VGGELFFQKHVDDPKKMPGVKQLDQALDPDHPPMLEDRQQREGILSCAQWNVIEFHTQNAVEEALRQAGPHRVRPRPGRGRGWPDDAGSRPGGARLPAGAGTAERPQDQRRQGPARGGADQAEARTGTP
jgi:hypothetical protein